MDFYHIVEKKKTQMVESEFGDQRMKVLEIYPDFCPIRSKDLMVRGRSFYAIWDEEKQLWSTDESDVQRLVDKDIDQYVQRRKETWHGAFDVKRMISYSSNMWHSYKLFLKDMFDASSQLDENITFANTVTKKTDHVSKRLSYPLEEGPIAAYDELMSTLYDPEERKNDTLPE